MLIASLESLVHGSAAVDSFVQVRIHVLLDLANDASPVESKRSSTDAAQAASVLQHVSQAYLGIICNSEAAWSQLSL